MARFGSKNRTWYLPNIKQKCYTNYVMFGIIILFTSNYGFKATAVKIRTADKEWSSNLGDGRRLALRLKNYLVMKCYTGLQN
jgi:hypothetical protein